MLLLFLLKTFFRLAHTPQIFKYSYKCYLTGLQIFLKNIPQIFLKKLPNWPTNIHKRYSSNIPQNFTSLACKYSSACCRETKPSRALHNSVSFLYLFHFQTPNQSGEFIYRVFFLLVPLKMFLVQKS